MDHSEVGGVDRLSRLPDDVLSKILGFLCIQHAAQTQGLARRWRHLWSSNRDLRFTIKEDWVVPYQNSPRFVEDVIARYKGRKVPSFYLCVEGDAVSAKQIDSWIRFAMDRDVSDLHLTLLEPERPYKVPPELLCCSLLTLLHLESCELDVAGSVCLSSLKGIRLCRVNISRSSLEKLTSGSPVLEHVDLDECNTHSNLYVYITNPSVKRVSVRDRRDGNYLAGAVGLFKIYAPGILFLDLGGLMRPKYILRNVSSLDGVSLDFKFDNEGDVLLLKELLGSLTSCDKLQLCGWCIQVLSLSVIKKELFSILSVTTLHLDLPLLKCEILGLSRLVEISPNLQSLTINFGFWNEGVNEAPCLWSFFSGVDFSNFFISQFRKTKWDEAYTREQNNIEEGAWDLMDECFSGKLLKLKTVELRNFYGLGFLGGGNLNSGSESFIILCSREIKLVAFLLKSSPVLEEINIIFPGICYSKVILDGITQGLQSLPMASSKAKLFFC